MKLPFLFAPKLRIAEVSSSPSVHGAQGFSYERWSELTAYRPNVLVGTASELQLLLESIERLKFDLSCVDYAVAVLTYSSTQLLDDVVRVSLWHAFGVPIHELLVGPNATLLAVECQAHEGWHIEPEVETAFSDGEIVCIIRSNHLVQTGWTGCIEIECCPCGVTSPRWMDLALPCWTTSPKLAATA